MKVKDAIKLIGADGWRLAQREAVVASSKPGTVTIAGHPSADLDRSRRAYTEAGWIEMSRYTVFIEPTAIGFSAHVPDLPGCVAAASTLPETRQLIREAIEFHIEGMKLNGEPPLSVSSMFSASPAV